MSKNSIYAKVTKNETTMKAIRYTISLCLALLCLCGCNDIPHDGEAIIGHGATTYYGGTKQGKYDGYGVLYVGDRSEELV